jgi:hypothetical protein
MKISRYVGKTSHCLNEKIMFPNESVIAASETKSAISTRMRNIGGSILGWATQNIMNSIVVYQSLNT